MTLDIDPCPRGSGSISLHTLKELALGICVVGSVPVALGPALGDPLPGVGREGPLARAELVEEDPEGEGLRGHPMLTVTQVDLRGLTWWECGIHQ